MENYKKPPLIPRLMTVLSDRDIKKAISSGKIVIQGLQEEHIGPSSIDLRLGNKFMVFKHAEVTHIDPRENAKDELMSLIEIPEGQSFIIHPGEFVLSNTMEYVKLPGDMVGRLDGRSSWGRLGIVIHSTAGSIDPGFEGQLTLEMANISKVPVKLWPGSRICRLTFDMLSSPSENPYNTRKGSKYLKQTGPQPSRISGD